VTKVACIEALLVLMMLQIVVGCRAHEASPRHGGDTGGFAEQAEKMYPLPEIVRKYEHALAMYRSGNIETGIHLVRGLAQLRLSLAPDSVWNDEHSLAVYQAGRQIPTLKVLRDIWRKNREYAKELSAKGTDSSVLQVLSVNLNISHQMVHVEPPDTSCIIGGTTLWSCTWEDLSRELTKRGDRDGAERAKRYAEAAKAFVSQHIRPLLAAEEKQLQELRKCPTKKARVAKVRQLLHKSLEDARRLAQLWDREVLTRDCNQMLQDISADD